MGVVVFAALGPNPAPLVELLWALERVRGQRVEAAYLVVDEEGEYYLHDECLGPDRALDQLRDLIGPKWLPGQSVHVRVVEHDGRVISNDAEAAHGAAYQAAVWQSAREAIVAARGSPVIFGLAAGRRRTMTAVETAVFQLLARPQDRCFDVRVSDPRVEGPSGFFFPEQPEAEIPIRGGWVDARTVRVELVEVRLPRLRGLLAPKDLETYDTALAAGQAAIDAAEPPALVLDLSAGEARVNGERLPLSPSELVWFACLVHGRKEGGADGWVESADRDVFRKVASASEGAPWRTALTSEVLKKLLAGIEIEDDDEDALRTIRSKTGAVVRAWCAARRPEWRSLLAPELRRKKGALHQRLPLDPARLLIVEAGER